MLFIAVIVGSIVGLAVMHGFDGVVVGGVIGYLIAEILSLKTRVKLLEADLTYTKTSSPSPAMELPPVSAPVERRVETPTIQAPVTQTSATVDVESIAPSTPPVQSAPRSPDIIEQGIQWVKEFLTGGNTVVRVGVIVLFFGVAFLLKYAAEHSRLPIELRLAGVAIGAIVLLVIGARVRRKREGYGLTLEGAAIGVLSITIFAAFRLYHLLPAPLVFGLLVATFASCVVLSLAQNAVALAIFGVTGGFLAPVLASSGSGSHVALFSYFVLLNTVIVAIAWFKTWRLLNLVGFGFTFVIGTVWGARYYQPEYFVTTEPFLILFFFFYVAVAILFALRQAPALRHPVDGTLVFGVPIVGFLLQAALVRNYEYGLAWSAFALGGFYLALAAMGLSRGLSRLLVEAFLSLGVIFATLTIPLAVDGHWTAAAWAVEGAGVLWIGLRQSRLLAQLFGLLVQLGAGLIFLAEARWHGDIPLLNSTFVGILLISLAGWVSAFLLMRHEAQAQRIGGNVMSVSLLIWGLSWWYGGTFNEIDRHVSEPYQLSAWIGLIATTMLGEHFFARRHGWSALHYASLANLGLLFVALLAAALMFAHPFARWGFLAWPVAIGAYYTLLKQANERPKWVDTTAHAGVFWLLLAILGQETYWGVRQLLPEGDWSNAASGSFLALALLVPIFVWARAWPVALHRYAYWVVGAAPVIIVALAWIIAHGIAAPGNPAPLPYLPLLNPLDLAVMFLLLALGAWAMNARELAGLSKDPVLLCLGVATFTWLNAVLFRSLHHFAAVPYELDAMWRSILAQAAISIFWTVLAFSLMIVAARVRVRYLWVIGGTLLAVVVAKLFLVDLSNSGTVAGIVSFVGVGVLLLVIGYLAPIPPSKVRQEEATS